MAVARRMAHENVTAGNGLRRAIFSFRLGGYADRRRELPLRRLASHESMDRLARRGTNPPKNASTFAPVLLPLFVDAQCGTNRCLWAKLSTRSSRDTSLLGVSMVSRGTSATSAMVGVGAHHVLCDRGLTQGDPELAEFAVDARRTAEGVRLRHRADQPRTSPGTLGRPVRCRLFQVQKRRNPRRCHATMVAGCRRTSAGLHSVQIRENQTQSSRSAVVRRRRGRRERSRTCNWCRSARISRCSVAREPASGATGIWIRRWASPAEG